MPYSNVQWNFLTPYLTPLAGQLERSVPQAMQHSRFNRSFAESNKRWGEGRPQRDASLEATMRRNVKSKEALKRYQLAVYGTEGDTLDNPMDLERFVANAFANKFTGGDPAQGNLMTSRDAQGVQEQKWVPRGESVTRQPQKQKTWVQERQADGSIQYRMIEEGQTATSQPDSQLIQTENEIGRPTQKFVPKRAGDEYPAQRYGSQMGGGGGGPGGKGGGYTPQQLVDDTRSHYAQIFNQQIRGMLHPVTGMVLSEFREQYKQILNDITAAYNNDLLGIGRGILPSWLSGQTAGAVADQQKDQSFLDALKALE